MSEKAGEKKGSDSPHIDKKRTDNLSSLIPRFSLTFLIVGGRLNHKSCSYENARMIYVADS